MKRFVVASIALAACLACVPTADAGVGFFGFGRRARVQVLVQPRPAVRFVAVQRPPVVVNAFAGHGYGGAQFNSFNSFGGYGAGFNNFNSFGGYGAGFNSFRGGFNQFGGYGANPNLNFLSVNPGYGSGSVIFSNGLFIHIR